MAYFPPTGSVVGFQSDPTKLVGTVSVVSAPNTSVAVVSAVPHSVATLQGTNPWMVSNTSVAVMSVVPHSVATLQGTDPWVISNSSVQVVGVMPVQSVSGVGLFNVNHVGGGSILANLQNSSVAILQGTNPIVTVGSVQGTVSVIGTVPVTQAGAWSVVGTYAEDSAHATAQNGLFILGVRNDAVASFTSANSDYGPLATDSQGRVLVKPHAPVEASVWATASTVNAGFGTNQAASVRVLAAPGAGLKWYITDMNLSNTGAATTLVTLTDDSSNTLWKGIVPAGGGNNMPGLVSPVVSANANTPLGLVSGTASSVVHLWVAGYKAP